MKIITGRATCRPESKILGSISDLVRNDPLAGILVIVPPNATHITQKKIIEMSGTGGILGVQVMSPQTLVGHISDKVYGRALPVIDDAGRCMIFCRILDEYASEIPHLGITSSKSEMSKGLSDFLSLLKSMNISPEDLKSYETDDPDFAARLEEISFVLDKFSKFGDMKGCTQQDMYNIACDHIGDCSLVKNSDVFIFGFDSFTEQLISLISALDRSAKSVTLSIVTSKKQSGDDDIFGLQNSYLKKLRSACECTEERVTGMHTGTAPEIHHTERYLFTYPPQKMKASDNVGIFSCADTEQETAACCEKAAQLIKSGMHPSEIAVVAANIAEYRNYIKKYFGEAHIPYFLSEKRTLAENPLGVFILSALRLCTGRLEKYRILEHIKCNISGTEHQRAVMDEKIRTAIKNPYRLCKPFDDKKEEQARQAVIVPLLNFIDEFKKEDSACGKTDALEKYLKKAGVQRFIAEMEKKTAAEEFVDSVDYYAQLPDRFSLLFKQIRLFGGKTDCMLYYDMMKSAMESMAVAVIPALSDAVVFGNIHDLYMPWAKAVMILGANEGVIPDFEEKSGILSDRQFAMLSDHFTGINEEDMMSSARFLVYKAVASPSDALYLFYHEFVSTDTGRTRVYPSPVVRNFSEIFSLGHEKAEKFIGSSLVTNALIAAKENMAGGNASDLSSVLSSVLENTYLHNRMNMLKSMADDNTESNLPDDIRSGLYPVSGSASFFQAYFECPFRFFMQYGIRPKTEIPPEMEYSAIGRYIHGVLDAYAKDLKDKGLSIKQVTQEELEKGISEVGEKVRQSGKYGEPDEEMLHIMNVLESEVRDVLSGVKENKDMAESDIVDTERKIDMDVDGMRITGSIDRVDMGTVLGQKYFSVVDYKTGSSQYTFSIEDFMKGLSLQLPLYMAAVARDFPDAKPVGGGYLNVGPGFGKYSEESGIYIDDRIVLDDYFGREDSKVPEIGLKYKKDADELCKNSAEKLYTEKEVSDIVKYTTKLIRKAKSGIDSGNIKAEPTPNQKGEYKCSFCDYRDICARPHDKGDKSEKVSRGEVLDIIAREVADSEL